MTELANVKISFFQDSFHSQPNRTVTLRHVLESIRTGTYASQVRYVRQILATRGQAAYNKAKSSLIAVTFAGTFSPTRGNTHLEKHSGLLHVDMDHLRDVAAMKQALSDDPYLAFAFISPSGGGLKAGVRIPIVTSAEQYAYAWHTVRAAYEQRYSASWDQATKDVARLCFVSYDPGIYVNFEAQVFDVPPAPAPESKPKAQTRRAPLLYQADRRRAYAERAIRTAVDMIQTAPLGTRHHTRLKAARLLGGYVASGLLTDEEAYGALARALVGHTEDLKKALDTVEDGLKYGQAHPISPDDLEAEREAWIQAHRTVAPVRHAPPVDHDPWEGRRTLPLKPYTGLRLGKAVRRG
jgi:VirE N-terminal domain